MSPHGKKLGLLISAAPSQPNFDHGLKLAEAALASGVTVYLYCIYEAVPAVADPRLQALKARGLNLYACAFGAHRQKVQLDDRATFAGLSVVSELIASTDRFVSFH